MLVHLRGPSPVNYLDRNGQTWHLDLPSSHAWYCQTVHERADESSPFHALLLAPATTPSHFLAAGTSNHEGVVARRHGRIPEEIAMHGGGCKWCFFLVFFGGGFSAIQCESFESSVTDIYHIIPYQFTKPHDQLRG